MKKLLTILTPTYIAMLSLLAVTLFLRYYLFINSAQLVKEFKNQNYKELYSMDSLQVSSRINSLSTVINWVCLEGSISNQLFYKMHKGNCSTGVFQQRQYIIIPEANNTKISFTVRLPKEVEVCFLIFLLFQICLILALINSTQIMELEKHSNEARINKIARQVSHDIRSPLATLNTIIDSILEIPNDDQKLLKEAILRINQISNNLLSNSQKNFSLTPLPINQVTNINESLISIIDEKKKEFLMIKNLEIVTNLSPTLLYATLDPYEFKRCISNMINNSIEACKARAVVKLIIELNLLDDKSVAISIEDNGSGISREILKDLGTKEITSKIAGNGLGLMHTFENIKNWHGKVIIDSEVYKWTKITILLPSFNAQNITSILIDDDELVRITWLSVAKKLNKNLKTYTNYNELLLDLNALDKTTIFYIDSNLSEQERGEEIALELYNKGFLNLFITTGYESERFKNLNYLKGVKDKSPPWK